MTASTSTIGTEQRRIGFGAALASEWAKLWSVRSTWITLGLTLLLSAGIATLLGISLGATADSPQVQMDAFDPIMFSLPGTIFVLILLSVLGVMYASSEYSSGMIRLTLAITPQRWRILAAKALIIGVVSLIVGSVATVAMFAISQALFAAAELPSVTLDDPDALRAILGISLTAPVFPLIGLALAFLLRSTAGAITAVLGLIFLPDVFGLLLPLWWLENVLPYLPAAASDAISIGHLEQVSFALEIGPAIAAVVAWVAASLALAYVAMLRRDA